MNCLFCKIVSGDIPGSIIYEDDKSVVLLDVNPISPGHTLVIPKIHADNILELEDDEVGLLFLALKKATNMLNVSLKPKGFTIGINQGRISGQMVDHLHIHIIPRYEGDGGGSMHSVVDNPPKETLEDIKKKILESNK